MIILIIITYYAVRAGYIPPPPFKQCPSTEDRINSFNDGKLCKNRDAYPCCFKERLVDSINNNTTILQTCCYKYGKSEPVKCCEFEEPVY